MGERTFGDFLKHLRSQTGMTLRAFCQNHGIDPGNWSKLERGVLPPPHTDKLEQYANYLGLKKGMDEWLDFFDLAAAARGELPGDVMNNAKVVDQLPVLFRTLRGQRVDPEKLDQLIEMIKQS